MQEEEFKKAKMKDMEEKKKAADMERIEREKKLAEEKRLKDEEIKQKQIEESKKLKSSAVPPEPLPLDPNSCEIAFRMPSGKRVVRRFLKTNTIESLYNFIGSLGEPDIDNFKYEISQPIPKRVYADMSATLEKEGLIPKAVVQVAIIE